MFAVHTRLLFMLRQCLLGISLLTMTGCGKQADTEAPIDFNQAYPPQAGGTLISATIAEPSGLIPMIAGEAAASAIAANIFNTLLKYDKKLEINGELAKS